MKEQRVQWRSATFVFLSCPHKRLFSRQAWQMPCQGMGRNIHHVKQSRGVWEGREGQGRGTGRYASGYGTQESPPNWGRQKCLEENHKTSAHITAGRRNGTGVE